jgi:cytochrome P450
MSTSWLPDSLRRRVVRAVLARHVGRDVSALRGLPASSVYPLRRVGLDPVPELAAARERAPVTRLTTLLGTTVWLVTGYAEARAVLADATRFSNDMRPVLGTRARSDAESIGGLGMTDDPDHGRLRGLLTPEFTRHRLARLQGDIDTIVADTLDTLADHADDGRVDLVPHFGFAIPFRVICSLLGLSVSERADFHQMGAARFDLTQGGIGVFDAATESRAFLIDAVTRQRRQPGDGLIGAVLTSHGDAFSDVELGGLMDGVFLGGYETSASMLSMGVYLLAQHRDAYARLRTGSPTEVDAIIEELLRYLCPVQVAFPRFARTDLDLFGQRVGRGDVVVVSLTGANRDPRWRSDPELFDPSGEAAHHLAFGHGLHRCVGAELARMELRSALVGIATRFPDLTVPAPDEVSFRQLSVVYSIDALPARLV